MAAQTSERVPDDERKAPHATRAREIITHLETDPKTGLTDKAARARHDADGPNQLREQTRKSLLTILKNQFESIIVLLLSVAAGLSFAFGEMAEGLAIVALLLINAGIGFYTELRAIRSMEALRKIADVQTRVRRDGSSHLVDAPRIVRGDVVLLQAGDVVTADLRLFEASNLQADEAVLTGESTPVEKITEPLDQDTEPGDRANMVFKGTAITQGAGKGVAVATGMDTQIGHISNLAQGASAETAPLEERLDRLGHRLVLLSLALAVIVIGAGLVRGSDLKEMIQTGVALAVASVPEGLPIVATLSLARGMWRMSARNALITRLTSVETLGATTVILTDKTGTLTENHMTVVRYLLDGDDVDLDNDQTNDPFHCNGEHVPPDEDDRLCWALRIGALCTNADTGDEPDNGTGDPMEIALLEAAQNATQGRETLLSEFPERNEHAFDPELKMMATVHENGSGYLVAVKGAPEAVLENCTQVMVNGGKTEALDDAARDTWMTRNTRAAQCGLRLLALAMKHVSDTNAAPYDDLTLIGLVCLLDPVRKDVPDAIAACARAGVRVIMLTGDHADTARTIARKAGIGGDDLSVIEGHELGGRGPGDLDQQDLTRIKQADVFARVSPQAKLTLVSVFQDAGHVVAMTGDGVNDAPALKKADIGIAMGQRGTEVAKDAARMVLRDDAFSAIIHAMREGRVIFGNIRDFAIYMMSCNISQILVVGLAVAAGLPTPLLPMQILYLNVVTGVFPALALGLGPGSDTVMTERPRDPKEAIVNRQGWVHTAALGGFLTIAILGAFVLALFWLRLETGAAVTVAFLTLALGHLWNVFNLRDPATGLFLNNVTRNIHVWGAVLLCLGLIAAAIWVPGVSGLLRVEGPGLAGLGLAAVASLLPVALGQIRIGLVMQPDRVDRR